MKKRLLSCMLTITLMLAMYPVTAWGEEADIASESDW